MIIAHTVKGKGVSFMENALSFHGKAPNDEESEEGAQGAGGGRMKYSLCLQRKEYGRALIDLGKTSKEVVVLDADLSSSTRTADFAKEFPEHFFNCGIAEQNMMGTAAGLAVSGKVVFASTFAVFATGRCWDQIRQSHRLSQAQRQDRCDPRGHHRRRRRRVPPDRGGRRADAHPAET